MDSERFLPNRPANDDIKIPVADKDMIAYAVAFGIPNIKAFTLWHPEYLDGSGKLNKEGKRICNQFFAYNKNRDFAERYKGTLEAFLSKKKSGGSVEPSIVIDDARKDNARVALYNKVIKLIEGDEDLDPDTLKIAVDMAKKLSIVADDVVEQEAPRRYLPAKCSECAYRLFVESHVKNGDIISECDYCRTRRFAEKNGWRYDATRNLELPEEFTDKTINDNNHESEI